MRSAPGPGRPALRLLCAAAVGAIAVLAAATPAVASTDPLAGRTLTGRLVQAYPESAGPDAPAEQPLSWLQPATGAAVRLDTAELADVPAGATVRVTVGRAVDDGADGVGTAHGVARSVVLSADGTTGQPDTTGTTTATTTPTGTDTTTPLGTGSAAAGSTTAAASSSSVPTTTTYPAAGLTDRVTVVLVEAGGGAADATTTQQLRSAVDGEVHDFWSEQTGGAVDLGVTSTTDWVPTSAGCATPTTLWDQAAAAAGFTPGPGNHLLVYVSSRSNHVADCSYGLAEIGSGLGSGGRLYVQATLPSLIAHELGHNFGLGHSSGKQCDGTVDTGRCRIEGYRDYYDVMAASWEHVGTLNAAQEARLGVLPAAQQRTLTADGPGGSVTLAPLSGRTGVRALELTAADGTDYWLEYRPATGQDAWLDTPADRLGLQPGVLLHRSGALPDTSLLLDGTPSAAAGWDADLQDALPTGTPLGLADGFTVTLTGQTAAGAAITVTTSPAAEAAAPAPSAGPVTRLPGSGCRSGCPSAATEQPAAPHAVGSLLPYSIPAAGDRAHASPGRAAGMTLAALHSTPAIGAGVALVGCAGLGAWVAFSRLRARSLRRHADPRG